MANTKQAAKRAKQSQKRRGANVSLRTTLRTAIKKVQKAIEGGNAVNGRGHGHPEFTAAIAEQSRRLIHTSNHFVVPEQERAAEKVCALANMDNAFFCNSGAESNECAIKLARLYGHQRGIENATIIVMEKAWHGRTLATLSATGSRKAQAGFQPLIGGVLRLPYHH